MGYYLETGTTKGKYELLLEAHAGRPLDPEVEGWERVREGGEAAICILDNGGFEAAGFAYSFQEFNEFLDDPLGRPQKWLAIPWEVACKETSYDDTGVIENGNDN